jgi:hypothetical protein
MCQEECPYEGVVGETALTFDSSAIVFSVVGDTNNSILVNDTQRLLHFLRIPTPSQLCIQPRLLLFQRHVTLRFLQRSTRRFNIIRPPLLVVFFETLLSCKNGDMRRCIERFVDLKLTTEVEFRNVRERFLEVILGDSK